MAAEQNEGGNIPAHDEHANGHTHDGSTDGVHIAKIFRSQEQRIGTKAFHEAAVYHAEHDDPECKQHLVLPEMQEDQLYRKRVEYTPQVLCKRCFHSGPKYYENT